jgi:hypothetical protein
MIALFNSYPPPSNYGVRLTAYTKGARLRGGLTVQGGTSTGQQVIDSCEVRDKLPEQVSGGAFSQGGIPYNPTNPYCHVAPGITTRATAAGSYIVPRADVQLSFAFTTSPGVPLRADWQVPSAIAALSLGTRCPGTCPPSASLCLRGNRASVISAPSTTIQFDQKRKSRRPTIRELRALREPKPFFCPKRVVQPA